MTAASNKRLLPRNLDGLIVLLLISWFIGFMSLFSGELFKPDFFDKYRLDFSKFYSMGQLIVSADRGKLYDTRTQYQWLGKNCKLPALGAEDTALMFAISSEQPPPFFLLFSPFGILPQRVAFIVAMLIFGLLTILAALMLNRCRDLPFSKAQMFVLLLGAFGSGPAVSGILQGHTNWLITGLAGLFAAAYLRNQPLLSGLFLACFVIKPQYGIFLMIPPLFERRWKVIGYAAMFTGLFLALSALIAGPQCVLGYPSVIMSNDVAMGNANDQLSLMVRTPPQRMITWRGFLSTFLDQKLVMQIAISTFLLAAGWLGATWMRLKKTGRSRNWAMAITVMSSIIFGLHNLFYDCSIFLVAAVLTLPNLSLLSAFRQPHLSMKIWMLGMLLYPLATSVVFLGIISDVPRTRVLFVYAVVLFVAAICQFILSSKGKTGSVDLLE